MASWLYEEQTSGRRIGHRLRPGKSRVLTASGPVLVDMEAGNGAQ